MLQRGANLDVAKNEHGETAFQITAKFPQIKMEAYKEHIKELKRKKTKKPKESMHTFMKEAEGISREMAKIILTQKEMSMTRLQFQIESVTLKTFAIKNILMNRSLVPGRSFI